VTTELTPEVVRGLARLGALARLEQIEAERKAIVDMFPDLAAARRGRRPGRPAKVATRSAGRAAKPARKRSRMSAAARKAVSERMKKYWADRRKAKAKA
jgi:hypothetical protein